MPTDKELLDFLEANPDMALNGRQKPCWSMVRFEGNLNPRYYTYDNVRDCIAGAMAGREPPLEKNDVGGSEF